jgi:cell division protein FtsW
MQKDSKKIDWVLFSVILIILAIGILTLASVSAAFSQQKVGNPYYFLKRQMILGFLPGIILAILAFKIKLSFFEKWALIFFLGNLILMAIIFFPIFGRERLGAVRWLEIGPISFQPSEFLKISSILYFSALFCKKRKSRENLLAFLATISIISVFLIKQPDISTLGIIILVSIFIYFAAGNPGWHILLIGFLGILILAMLIKFEPYRLNRVLAFLNPERDPMGISYHQKQALMAVGSGGIYGLGIGMSKQKFGFLPQSISDSIFAIFAEETGFLGSAVLIFLFLIFLWRGFEISKKAKDQFSKLLSLGITCLISLQAFINIASMIRILPLMGMPLPFISYGGSALVSGLIGIGILLNISKS